MDVPDVIAFLRKDKVIINAMIEDIQANDPAALSISKEFQTNQKVEA